MSGIIWIIVRRLRRRNHRAPAFAGPEQPERFILTTVLGIVGAFLATFIGQAIGHYGPRSGRRLHHRHHRRTDRAVHLERLVPAV